ncbi:MAG: hypothetical protein K2H08_05835 [Duncaniella sp.]|nr:hypothetical protein [Duncaniella sp.]
MRITDTIALTDADKTEVHAILTSTVTKNQYYPIDKYQGKIAEKGRKTFENPYIAEQTGLLNLIIYFEIILFID